jgi:GNAT superfamily N-acetyltransferase
MGEKIEVIRLKRVDLYSPTYQWLIESLFPKEQFDKRLRYAKWIFDENPFLQKTEDLPIYIYRIDTIGVGHLAIIPTEIVFDGNLIRGGWCIDFFVNLNYQRRGIGKKLLAATYQDFPVLMTLGQTDAAFELFSAKLGWHYNDNRLTHYKISVGRHFLLKYFAIKVGLLKRAKPNATPEKPFEGPKGVIFRSIDSFKEIIDSLNRQDLRRDRVALILRTPAFLQWRYGCHPFVKYNINYVRPSNLYDIYIVWRIVTENIWRTAKIVDILYDSNIPLSAMKTALKVLIKCASFYGAEILECETSDTFVLKALPNNLLSVKDPGKRFLYSMQAIDKCPFFPIDHWKLFAADCDVDAYDFGS